MTRSRKIPIVIHAQMATAAPNPAIARHETQSGEMRGVKKMTPANAN
jgi:hypothetical protein